MPGTSPAMTKKVDPDWSADILYRHVLSEIRPAAAADLPAITEIYRHAVLYGTATFELLPPDLTEMTRRFGMLMDGGFPYLVASP